MPAALPKIGEGFTVRDFTREDAEALASIEFDADVKRFLALPKLEKAQWVKKFDPDTYGGWAIDVDGVLAGRASILRGSRRGDGELAIVISRAFWGEKLGRKVARVLIQMAFEEMNATALLAKVHPENKASIALLRAFKFHRRGVLDESPESWQLGHFVYRLSRRSYNTSTQGRQPLATPGLQR